MLWRPALALLLCGALAACSVTRHVATPYDKLTLTATDDLNPDPRGRAAPLIVKVYELSDRSTFDYIDFDAAFSNAQVVLSDQLLTAKELVVLPKQSVLHRTDLQPETAFIGIVAAYREIDRARWKLIYPVNSNWFQDHAVRLTADAAVLESQDDQKTPQ